MVKNYYFKSSCSGKMIRFLRWNWIIRGGVVTPVCKIVLFYFIASKKTKNYHLLWFLVTIDVDVSIYAKKEFDNYILVKKPEIEKGIIGRKDIELNEIWKLKKCTNCTLYIFAILIPKTPYFSCFSGV